MTDPTDGKSPIWRIIERLLDILQQAIVADSWGPYLRLCSTLLIAIGAYYLMRL